MAVPPVKVSEWQRNEQEKPEVSFKAMTEALAQGLSLDRVSIWLINEAHNQLQCHDLFFQASGEHFVTDKLEIDKYPILFRYLEKIGPVFADNVITHPATPEILDLYLRARSKSSVIIVPIIESDRVKGIIWGEQTEKLHHWSSSEQKFALNFSSIIAKSITYKEKIEEHKNQAMAASKMAELGVLAGAIAHEICNPLSVILNHSEFLLEEMKHTTFDREKMAYSANKILTTSIRIEKIIKGLRFFTRSNDSDPMASVTIESILEDTLSLCRAKLKENQCSIDVIYETAGLSFPCHSVSISQALLNLINNACDVTSPLKEKWIRINTKKTENHIEIRVLDSGSGIPKEIREKLMEPFFTTKPCGKGTGLGLSIVKGIIDQHKGRFFIDELSHNTCFVIQLPLNP